MKKMLGLLLCTLTIVCNSIARIGETKEQLDERYGTCFKDELNGEIRALHYAKGEFLFRFEIFNNTAVSMFIKKQSNIPLETEEIANFLAKSGGDKWQCLGDFGLKGSVWSTSDEILNAQVGGGNKTLLIIDRKYSEYKLKKESNQKIEKMSDF
jgi:hypothetical protein